MRMAEAISGVRRTKKSRLFTEKKQAKGTAVMNGNPSIEKDDYIKPKKAWRLLKMADDENVTAYIF